MSTSKNTEQNFLDSLKRASFMMLSIIPMIMAIVGLVGLFNVFVTPEMIGKLFTGSMFYDTFISTVAGSISVGQPVVSYIIGGELSQSGVSLYAVTAFILSFVTLGIIQLPMEYALFGLRFTLVRNFLSFLFAMIIAVVTVLILGALQ
jgi:uncharacterized membrane protein YraQ (UPF0718 family)